MASFPAFGDSVSAEIHGITHAVDTALLLFINERWGMGWTDLANVKNDMFASHPLGDRLYAFGLFGFPRPEYGNSLVAGSPTAPDETAQGDLRYFLQGGQRLHQPLATTRRGPPRPRAQGRCVNARRPRP